MMCGLEHLETRTLLSDAGNSFNQATVLGSVSGIKTINESLGAGDTDDYYKFSVGAKGNVNIGVSGLPEGASVKLLNASGSVIKTWDGEKISMTLNGGTYGIRVAGDLADATAYSMSIQADLNWTTFTQSGKTKKVGLVFADGSSEAINKNVQTWVVIHGWNSSPDSLGSLSDAVKASKPGDQVLALDWSNAAKTSSNMTALAAAPLAAKSAVGILKRWGIAGSKINLIGHSFGGFIVDRIAAGITGGVNRIVAIDPADDVVTDVNFAARSKFSLAFVATTAFCTPKHALTADVCLQMNIGDKKSILTHALAPEYYATLIQECADGSPDSVAKVFSLDRLTAKAINPAWKIQSGYDGTLTGTFIFIGWTGRKIKLG